MIYSKYKWFTKRACRWCLSLLILTISSIFSTITFSEENDVVRIGVLATRGKYICLQKWTETARYLTQKIESKTFTIVPLYFDEIDLSVRNHTVDFILVNPSMYVQFENSYYVSRIATLISKYSQSNFSTLGSVIISKADHLQLESIQALKNKSVAAVSPRSLGGWQIALARLNREGFDAQSDFKSLTFLNSHDLVVEAVMEGSAEIGIVSAGILEQMEAEGKVSLDNFSILPSDAPNTDFPLRTSTRLYPDWAFATTSHASDMLARKVAAALLIMKPDDKAADTAQISGWMIPENYTTVHELLNELELPPYHFAKPLTVLEFIIDHISIALIILFAFIILSLMYLRQRLLTQELRHAQNSLRNYSKRLQLAAQAGELGIWEWNIKQNRFYCDDRISQLFGIKRLSNIYTSQDWYNCVHPDDIEKVQTSMHLALGGGKKFDVEYRIVKTNKEICTVKSAAIYRYSQSRGGLVVNGVTWDISKHRQLLEENRRLATLDPLTNARNRRGFFPLARTEFNRCQRYGNKLALIMMDIDNFKMINDINGHTTGDATLVSLSDICHTVLRTSDLFCRLGGEEFIALLHENTLEQAHIVAERLRAEIEKTSVKTNTSFIKYTVSIGVSVLIEQDKKIEDTIDRADKALYQAKTQGKNRVIDDI